MSGAGGWVAGTSELWNTKSNWDSASVVNLSTNTIYWFKVRAKNHNDVVTEYSSTINEHTRAATPESPEIINVTTTTILVKHRPSGNPNYTNFSFEIDDDGDDISFNTLKYILENGTISGSADWVSTTTWSNKTIVNLSTNTIYKIRSRARNEEPLNTNPSVVWSTYTLCSVPPEPTLSNTGKTYELYVSTTPGDNPTDPSKTDTLFAVAVDTNVDTTPFNSTGYLTLAGTVISTETWITDDQWATTTVIGLSTNSVYYFKVKARNGDGVETAFGPSSYKYTRSTAPTSPDFVAVTSNTVTIGWNANGNPSYTDYFVEYYHNFPSLPPLSFTNAFSTSNAVVGIHTALKPGTTHYYQIKARNKDGLDTDYTNAITTLTYSSVPPIPTLTVAGPTQISIDVNGGDNHPDTEFSVVVDTTSNGISFDTTGYLQSDGTVGASQTWLTDTSWGTKLVINLTPNSIYRFKVNSRDSLRRASVPDTYSEEVWKYLNANPPVSSAVTAVYPSSVTVSWNANSNPVGTEFELWRSLNNSNFDFVTSIYSQSIGANSHVDTGLSADTTYYYKIRARNNEGVFTVFDTTISTMTRAADVSAPSVVVLSSVSLSVDINPGTNPTGTEYAIAVDTDADGTEFNVTSYVQSDGSISSTAAWLTDSSWGTKNVSGLQVNRVYRFKAKARNNQQVETGFSTVVSKYTFANTPVNVIASATENQITHTWTQESNPSGTQFSAEISPDSSFSTASTSQTVLNSATFYSLTPNTSYYLRVRAMNGDSTYTLYIPTVTKVTWCEAPVTLTFSNIVVSTITVNWSGGNNPAGTKYIAHASSVNFSGGDILSSTVTTTSTQFSSLSTNTTYWFRVYGVNHENVSTAYLGPTAQATSPDVPGSVYFASDISAANIIPRWTANSGKAGPYYDVEGSSDSGFGSDLLNIGWITDVAWNPGAIYSPNTRYYFRVKTKGHSGQESSWTSTGSTSTLCNDPAAASFSGVTASNIRANWTANSNPSWTEYYAERATNAGFTVGLDSSGWITALYYDFGGLSSNTTYYFRVKARNLLGRETSTVSLGTQATSPEGPGAADFTNVFISSVSANWTDNSGKAGPFYFTAIATDYGFSQNVSSSDWITSTGYAFTSLNANTTYFAWVKSKGNNGDESSWTSLGSTPTLCTAPVAAAASGITSSGVRANWTANNNPSGTQYIAEKSTWNGFTGTKESVTTTNTYYDFTSLSADTTYWFQIKAKNFSGIETAAISLDAALTLPAVPSDLKITKELDTEVTLSWTGAGIQSFAVDRSTDGIVWTKIKDYSANLTTTTYTDTSLTGSVTYYYRVWGYNKNGELSGSASNTVSKTGLVRISVTDGGTQTASDGTSVELPPNAVSETVTVVIRTDPANNPKEASKENIATANNKIPSDVAAIPNTTREFVAYKQDGTKVTEFAQQLVISIPYTDANQDGYVDNVVPRVKVETLKMFRLNETKKKWDEVENSEVNTKNKSVQALVKSFSVYTILAYKSASSLSGVIVYPNPYRPGGTGANADYDASQITFKGLTSGAKIKIFTLSGELVAGFNESSDGIADNGIATWNGNNDAGEPLASGMYFYLVTDKSGTEKITGRLGIVR